MKNCLECHCDIKSKRNGAKFCSRSCASKYNWKKRLEDDPEALAKFVKSGHLAPKIIPRGKDSPRWKGGLVKKTCKHCGNDFEVSKYKHKKGYGKYCSRECYQAVHIKPRIKAYCGKEVD